MLTLPHIWVPGRRVEVPRPRLPLRWRGVRPLRRHRPGCPLYNMADGDSSLNTSGGTILDATGNEYVKCCCTPPVTCFVCDASWTPQSWTVTSSGVSYCAGWSGSPLNGTWCVNAGGVGLTGCEGMLRIGTVTNAGNTYNLYIYIHEFSDSFGNLSRSVNLEDDESPARSFALYQTPYAAAHDCTTAYGGSSTVTCGASAGGSGGTLNVTPRSTRC